MENSNTRRETAP
jgi:exonuclease III